MIHRVTAREGAVVGGVSENDHDGNDKNEDNEGDYVGRKDGSSSLTSFSSIAIVSLAERRSIACDEEYDDEEDDGGAGPTITTIVTTTPSWGMDDDHIRPARDVDEDEEDNCDSHASIHSHTPNRGVTIVSDDSSVTTTTSTTILTTAATTSFFDIVDRDRQEEVEEEDVEDDDIWEENEERKKKKEEEEEEENGYDGSPASSSLLLGLSRISIARSQSWDGDDDTASDDYDGPADGRWNIPFDDDDDDSDDEVEMEDGGRSDSTSSPGNGRSVDMSTLNDMGFVPIGGEGVLGRERGRRRSPMSRTTTIRPLHSSYHARTNNFATTTSPLRPLATRADVRSGNGSSLAHASSPVRISPWRRGPQATPPSRREGRAGGGGSPSPSHSREASTTKSKMTTRMTSTSATTTRRNLHGVFATNQNKENVSPSGGGRGYVTIGAALLFDVR